MYYKSLIETLKVEDIYNRIILNEQVTDANNCYIDITLVPKDILISAILEIKLCL